ncbi:MAG: HAD family hydrolase [Actinomycetota bacterium]
MSHVFLFDVDNTLLDNDAVKADLEQALEASLSRQDAERFWELYEEVRGEFGLVSLPETVERFLPVHCADPLAPQRAARSIFECDFASHLRPGALELLEWASQEGTSLILSNGDQFFQRWKIWKAGLAAASGNRVWVFPEKEHHFEDLDERFDAGTLFFLVEDKTGALHAAREHWGERVVTIYVAFGHHAESISDAEAIDLVVSSPAELLERLPEIGFSPV